VTDSGQNVQWTTTYAPFGQTGWITNPNAITQDLRLPGMFADPEYTLFYHNGARDYELLTGRYVQTDPIGLNGGTATYQYANGNPFRFRDVYGLDPGSSCPLFSCGSFSAPTGGGGNSICNNLSDPACLAAVHNVAEVTENAVDLLRMGGEDVPSIVGALAGITDLGTTIADCSHAPTAGCAPEIAYDVAQLVLDSPLFVAQSVGSTLYSALPPDPEKSVIGVGPAPDPAPDPPRFPFQQSCKDTSNQPYGCSYH
jgi:RHS repeat-associated protein